MKTACRACLTVSADVGRGGDIIAQRSSFVVRVAPPSPHARTSQPSPPPDTTRHTTPRHPLPATRHVPTHPSCHTTTSISAPDRSRRAWKSWRRTAEQTRDAMSEGARAAAAAAAADTDGVSVFECGSYLRRSCMLLAQNHEAVGVRREAQAQGRYERKVRAATLPSPFTLRPSSSTPPFC
ncbi:hypothetical protein BC567DRAFT_237139 [Phyllosticta citribraziliensis]